MKISNYHPEVKEILKIKTPKGYLIPKNDSLLIEFVKNHAIKFQNTISVKGKIYQYEITAKDSILLEGEYIRYPIVSKKLITQNINLDDYIFIPLNQSKRDLIVLALEPQSMVGLVQYERFQYILQKNNYPFLFIR